MRQPNIRGDWQCSGYYGCGRWLGGHAFNLTKRTGKPCSRCRECDTAYSARYRRDVLWKSSERMAREQERLKRYYHRAKRPHRETDVRWRIERVQALVQGLLDQGWSPSRVGTALGSNWRAVIRWRDGTSQYVHPATYRKVAALARQVEAG